MDESQATLFRVWLFFENDRFSNPSLLKIGEACKRTGAKFFLCLGFGPYFVINEFP